MKLSAIFLALASVALPAASQTIYTLDELFNLADRNARSIRISEDALDASSQAVASARTQRLPEIGANLFLGYNGRGWITDRDFSDPMSVYIPEFANNFSLKVSQVIYAGGAITNSIRLSEMGRRMAELDMVRNRQEVRFYIIGQYLDMMRTLNTAKVIEQNIALTEEIIANTESRVDQGTALPNDVTRYELQLENLRLRLRQLSDAYTIINHNLCNILSLPADTRIAPDEGLLSQTLMSQDEQYWQELAATGNPGLKQAALAGEMSERRVDLARSAMLPRLALIAEYDLNSPVTIEIPALNKNFNYWFVGVGVQYNLSSLYKSRHDVSRARVERIKAADELELAQENTNNAVHAALVDLQTAQSELRTSELQVRLATENYNVVYNRYQNGLALITDMLDASNMMLAAEIACVQARINIVYCSKKLGYLSGGI